MFPVKNRKATQTKEGTAYNTKLQKSRLTWEIIILNRSSRDIIIVILINYIN